MESVMAVERVVLLVFVLYTFAVTGVASSDIREGIFILENIPELCINVRDEHYENVTLETPIVYYGQKYSSVIVNAAGTISFNKIFPGRYLSSRSITFPDKPLIPFFGPLWTNIDEGGACLWKTTNKSILNVVDDVLMIENGFSEFHPKLVLVVTWEEVLIDKNDPLKNATSQVILATDGEVTFSQFLYHSIHEEVEYLIGFNAGDRERGVVLLRGSGPLTPEQEDMLRIAYRIDGECITPSTSSCPYNSFAVSCTPAPNITATVCNCSEGFIKNGEDCEDIDECAEGTHGCISDMLCLNVPGDYKCCDPGYTVDSILGECIGPVTSTEISSTKSTSEPGTSDLTAFVSGIVIGLVTVLVFGVTLIIIIVLLRRRKNRWLLRYGVEVHDYTQGVSSGHNLHHAGSMIQLVKLPKSLKIPFEDLEFDAKMIGEGEFGIVYKAKYKKEVVAVKILKGISNTSEIRKVVEEIMRMRGFSHANILPLTGVAIDNHFSPCIVMPFMWNGSLDYFLQKDENRVKYLISPDRSKSGFEVEDVTGKLLEMCLQIAKGMAYLSSEKIIHRDLAARNCMISLDNVIKVADFGLSVSMGEDKDYFRLADNTHEKLPVKWMAIETLLDHKFSEASDVWSFGVTCWEVFNGGMKPYPEIRNKDIIREISGGYRMSKPPNKACSSSVYTLMNSCWEREPTDRPTFSDLVNHTSSLLQELKDYLPLVDSQQNLKHNDADHLPPLTEVISEENFQKEEKF